MLLFHNWIRLDWKIDLFQSKKFYIKEILVEPGVNLTDMCYLIQRIWTRDWGIK